MRYCSFRQIPQHQVLESLNVGALILQRKDFAIQLHRVNPWISQRLLGYFSQFAIVYEKLMMGLNQRPAISLIVTHSVIALGHSVWARVKT